MKDDAGNGRIFVGGLDFCGNIFGGACKIIFDCDANILAIFDFKIDVFSNNRIIAIADNEEFGFF